MFLLSVGVECGWNRVRRACLIVLCAGATLIAGDEPPEVVTADLVRRLSAPMRERHPELRGLGHTVAAERLNADGSRRWADPDVMLGGALYRYADMARENGDLYYGVEQRLPILGKERAARALAASNAVSAGARLEARFAELRRDLAVSLFDAATARMAADLIAADVRWLETQVRLGRSRVASGGDPASMVLRLENELDRRRLDWTNALARRVDGEIGVQRLLGGAGDPVGGFLLPPVAEAVPFGPVLVRFAERAEPEVLRREQDLGVASATVEVTRRSQRPDVAVGVQSYHESATGTAAQGMLTVTMSVPWFNRANYRRDLQRDRARLASVEASVEDARQAVRREVHRLVTQIDSARREAVLMRDVVLPRTRRLQESLEGLWTSGRVELRELLDTRRQRVEAEMSEVRATGEYWVAMSELLLCCGLEDLETVRELLAGGGSGIEGGTK